MEAVDSYIPTPERAIDKPLLMAVEDVFSISGRGRWRPADGAGQGEGGGQGRAGGAAGDAGHGGDRGGDVPQDDGRAIAGDNVGLLLRGSRRTT